MQWRHSTRHRPPYHPFASPLLIINTLIVLLVSNNQLDAYHYWMVSLKWIFLTNLALLALHSRLFLQLIFEEDTVQANRFFRIRDSITWFGESSLVLFAVFIGSCDIVGRLELASVGHLHLAFHQATPTDSYALLRRNPLELGLVEITGTALVERVIRIVVIFFGLAAAVAKRVVVPSLDNHLSEKNKGNRIERHRQVVFFLQLSVVEQVSWWL